MVHPAMVHPATMYPATMHPAMVHPAYCQPAYCYMPYSAPHPPADMPPSSSARHSDDAMLLVEDTRAELYTRQYQIRSKLDKLEFEVKAFHEEKERFQEEKARLQAELDQARLEARDQLEDQHRQELSALRVQYDAANQAEKARLQAELDQARLDAKEKDQLADQYRQELSTLRDQYEMAKQEIESLKVELLESQALSSEAILTRLTSERPPPAISVAQRSELRWLVVSEGSSDDSEIDGDGGEKTDDAPIEKRTSEVTSPENEDSPESLEGAKTVQPKPSFRDLVAQKAQEPVVHAVPKVGPQSDVPKAGPQSDIPKMDPQSDVPKAGPQSEGAVRKEQSARRRRRPTKPAALVDDDGFKVVGRRKLVVQQPMIQETQPEEEVVQEDELALKQQAKLDAEAAAAKRAEEKRLQAEAAAAKRAEEKRLQAEAMAAKLAEEERLLAEAMAAKQAEATKPASARVEKVVRNKDLVEKARLLAKISRVNIDKQTMRRELAAMKTVDRGHPDYQKEMKNNKRYLKECMSMHGLDDDIDVNLRFDGEDAIFTISRRDYPDSRVEYRGTEVYQLSYLDNVLNVKKLLEKMDVNALRATRITPKPLASKYIMTVADRMRTLNPDSETDDHWDMANIIHHVDRRCTEAFGE